MLADVEDCGEDGGTEATASSSGECDFDHGLEGKEKSGLRKVYACLEALPVHVISPSFARQGCCFEIIVPSAASTAPNACRVEASDEAMKRR